MQNLTKLIQTAKKSPNSTDQHILNLIREYLQVLCLKAIYQSKYGRSLSFVGGTCLRICYDLKRFSEDLDFTYDRKIQSYSFDNLNQQVASFLKSTDFVVDLKVSENKVVQKSFIKVSRVLHTFGLSPLKNQKLQIKLEVDTQPVKVKDAEVETFFVTKFNEMFPILKHSDPTLFAGKISAALNREYTKGRDFYDLIWYLNQKIDINLNYLNQSFKQAGKNTQFKDSRSVIDALQQKVKNVNVQSIMKDVGRFLEDPDERKALENYQQLFNQVSTRYLKS